MGTLKLYYQHTTLGVGGGMVHIFAPLQVTYQASLLFHHTSCIIGLAKKEGKS